MGQAPRKLTPLESALDFFGAELRHWRTLRQLSQAVLGRRTHDSGALIGKIEKGERFPSLALAQRLDAILDTGGALERLWPQLERERLNRAAPGDGPASSAGPDAGDLGLAWPPTPETTIKVVAELWKADLNRRSILVSAAWVASAFAGPTREWLLNRQNEVVQGWSGRQVSQSDIDALWEMCTAFTDVDQRLGGGYARSTLLHYVNQAVLPLLHGSYNDTIGRELMAATARLCDLCGYMSFDSGRQGLAQRYYIQALRLAQASGDRALGAHILTDMAMQAHYFGDATQALDLASAGLDCGSPVMEARCATWQGRAHALRGDQRACAQACAIAERAWNRAVPSDERAWTKVYTADHMTFNMVQMSGKQACWDELIASGEVQRVNAVLRLLFAAVITDEHWGKRGTPGSVVRCRRDRRQRRRVAHRRQYLRLSTVGK